MIQDKIADLIEDILRHPFEGMGKPEPLRHHLKGFWSRRITDEHRLVYEVMEIVLTSLPVEIIMGNCKRNVE